MLTKLHIKNFKRFGESEIELGNPVVFIGPNNSGKTTALQALALWDLGVKRWHEKRGDKPAPKQRPGVTINRRDLLSVPVPSARYLWRDLHLRSQETGDDGKRRTQNVLVEILVEGVEPTTRTTWRFGLEFDYANEESFYVRPQWEVEGERRMGVPEEARNLEVAFLPPMSGLAPNEVRLDPGAIQVRLGEGRTAEVLRNLCHQVVERGEEDWKQLVERIHQLFGVVLDPPEYIPERGELQMSYREPSVGEQMSGTSNDLDLSSAGRGLQQTLLLLSYLASNPGAVLLLDEPDAHLEILRQRQIYRVLTEAARERGSQVVVASHSEVLLNEAADQDVVVAFVGEPHRIDDRSSQVAKALKSIGFEQYYQAQIRRWVLYLEGATDLRILQAFARTASHPAAEALEAPFVHYIMDQPQKGRDHFFGLKEAVTDLEGFMVLDGFDWKPAEQGDLIEARWSLREIENYLCRPPVLRRFVEDWFRGHADEPGDLFKGPELEDTLAKLERTIRELVPPVALEDAKDPWWTTIKASDDFLDRLFDRFYARLDLSNLMRKSDYHRLAEFVEADEIHADVTAVLDRIDAIARRTGERAPSPVV